MKEDIKKILFLGHSAQRTGAPLLLLSFLTHLKNNTDQLFSLILLTGGDLENDYKKQCPVQIVSEKRHAKQMLLNIKKFLYLKLSKNKFDESNYLKKYYPLNEYPVIYSNTIACTKLAMALHVPGRVIIQHVHELSYAANILQIGELLKISSTYTTLFIAASEAVAKFLVDEIGIDKVKVKIIHEYSITKTSTNKLADRKLVRDMLGISDSDFIIGMCGTPEWRKGFDLFVLLGRYLRTKKNGSKYHFLWIGGDKDKHIEGMHDVQLLGMNDKYHFIPSADNTGSYYQAMDVFALTSREDPFSVAMLEAASAGLPIVCFDKAGGGGEFVGLDSGRVVPYLDVQAMADACDALVKDRELLQRVGEAAKMKVENLYTPRIQMNRQLSAIHESLGSQGMCLNTGNYQQWYNLYDSSDRIKNNLKEPKISLLLTTYNSNKEWLRSTIESVLKQLYINWELCIADDASSDDSVRQIINEYISKDQRIKAVFRESNGHISDASNSALELATGEWVALIDHDDLLASDAFAQVANCIRDYPSTRLIYSDEDKINDQGVRHDPHFKPDWNQDLFYSYNMVSHLGIYHRSIMEEIGGFRKGYEGAQDYDLTLRFIQRIQSDQIRHIPKVLYHWRVHPKSTACGVDVKPYALDAGQRALQDHFRQIGIDAKVELDLSGYYRVHYPLSEPVPLVSIIIPTHNQKKLLKKCVDSILTKTDYVNYEIIVIDNRSSDRSTLKYLEQISSESRIRIIRDEHPFNYSSLNNKAAASARGSVFCFLNNDIEIISEDWLSEIVSHAIRPDIGAVGAKLFYPDGTIQHAGVILGIQGKAGHAFKYFSKHDRGYMSRLLVTQNYSAVTAACLAIEKKKYDEISGFDEVNLPIALNDVDLCLKALEAGYRNLWTPHAMLIHHEGGTRGNDSEALKTARYNIELNYVRNRWSKYFNIDPAYSPNLTLISEDFSLAFPPRISSL